jgi:carboxypeptidase family protein
MLVLASLGVVLPRARAQSLYGGIRGTVRDSTGEPVSGASVTATSEEKGTQLRAKTDDHGRYAFSEVQPDSYDVRAEAAGRTFIASDISVSADDESQVDLKLPSQGQSGLTQGASTLKTRADVAITLDRNALVNLPNYDQNSTRYGFLAPGTQLRGTNAVSSQDPQNSLQLSIDGQLPSGTASQLDGTDNRDSINQLVVINAPLESLAEIRITTQSFDAETGQALSGVVTAQTRSGGNEWHGSALEFRRTSWAEAGNPNLQNPSVVSAPFFRVNLFGGSLGGPIVKKKLFIFGDYQGTRRSLGSTQVLNVPSALVRSTCLSGASADCDLSEYLPFDISKPSSSPLIYDPVTGKPFPAIAGCGQGQGSHSLGEPGYCIPESRLSQQAVNLLSLLPPPNLAGAVSNYSVSGAEAWDDDDYTTRVDDSLTAKLQLFGRYTFATYHIHSPSAFGNFAGGTGFGPDTTANTAQSPNRSLSSGFDYAFNPTLHTDFRFGFFRRKLTVLANSYNTTPATNAGILGVNLGDALTSGMPAILVQQPNLQVTSSAIDYGDGPTVNQCNCPLMETLQQFQWVNNWVKTHGNHVMKWGEDFRLAEDLSVVSPVDRSGTFTFTQKDTANPTGSGPAAGGLGLATFLIGDVSAFSRNIGDTTDAGVHQKRLFFYGQDTWRATPRLTLSYGLRWEIYFPETVTGKGDGGFLNLNTGMIGLAGYSCCNLAGNVQNSWRNLAPRLGIAYQLNDRTVVRMAYGRNFDSGLTFGRNATLNPPVVVSQALIQPTAAPYRVFQLGAAGTDPIPAINLPNASSSGEFPLPDNVVASALPTSERVPTLDQWNFSVQHELAANLSFELAYVGNEATHVVPSGPGGAANTINVNQPTIAGFVACEANAADCIQRYPFGNAFGWTQAITLNGGVASASYNALQAKVVKRFSGGYEFNANYTWGKGIGYQADYFVQQPRLNRGVNIFDRTHTFILDNVLDLPLGKGRRLFGDVGRVTNYFVGGWSLNTVTTWASGLPFSPSYAPTECSADRDTGPCRPNLVGPVQITGDRNNYFTTTGGESLKNGETIGPWQRPAVGTFGNAGFDSLRGPSFFDTDLVVAKNFSLSERFALQFRTDFVNVFNKVNLGLPSGCVDCNANGAQTGAIITTLAPNASQREIEFSLHLQF